MNESFDPVEKKLKLMFQIISLSDTKVYEFLQS